MQNKRLGKNFLLVVFSRMATLASGVLVGFLLPKMLSISGYGYYKVFTLYATYTALLHFGFVDGLLLKIAGKDYSELDPLKMRAYTRFFIGFESIVSVALMVFGGLFATGEIRFVVVMLAINMLCVNVTTHYQFISQAVQRFAEYSAKNFLVAVFKLLFVGALFGLYLYKDAIISYRIYLLGLNALDFSIMIWYVVFYREITFGKGEPFGAVKRDILGIFKTGIVLTLAYQVSHLVLVLDRQFVNLLFSTETFAEYSFAYNIVSLISTMISSLSIVLLPMLKQSSAELIKVSYKKSAGVVSVAAAAGLLCYFPLVKFTAWFLPNYQVSIKYIAIVLPVLLFTSVITVVMFTISKVLDMNFDYFKDCCIVLGLGIVTNTVAYILFKSPESISYASLLVAIIWFLISGFRLKRKIQIGTHKEFFYLLLISCGFLLIAGFIRDCLAGFLVYAVLLLILTAIFYASSIRSMMREVVRVFLRH